MQSPHLLSATGSSPGATVCTPPIAKTITAAASCPPVTSPSGSAPTTVVDSLVAEEAATVPGETEYIRCPVCKESIGCKVSALPPSLIVKIASLKSGNVSNDTQIPNCGHNALVPTSTCPSQSGSLVHRLIETVIGTQLEIKLPSLPSVAFPLSLSTRSELSAPLLHTILSEHGFMHRIPVPKTYTDTERKHQETLITTPDCLLISNSMQYCTAHAGRPYSLVCSSCHTLICADCAVVGEHRGHPTTTLAMSFETGIEQLKKLLNQLKEKKREVQATNDSHLNSWTMLVQNVHSVMEEYNTATTLYLQQCRKKSQLALSAYMNHHTDTALALYEDLNSCCGMLNNIDTLIAKCERLLLEIRDVSPQSPTDNPSLKTFICNMLLLAPQIETVVSEKRTPYKENTSDALLPPLTQEFVAEITKIKKDAQDKIDGITTTLNQVQQNYLVGTSVPFLKFTSHLQAAQDEANKNKQECLAVQKQLQATQVEAKKNKQAYLIAKNQLTAAREELRVLNIEERGRGIFTFTNCGATGPNGPAQQQCDQTYGPSMKVTSIAGIQQWKVPSSGNWRIEARGAQGGGGRGGLGAVICGTFSMKCGDILHILVGHCGGSGTGLKSGGGGGTFITLGPDFPKAKCLIVAGGGGGGGESTTNVCGSPGNGVTSGSDGFSGVRFCMGAMEKEEPLVGMLTRVDLVAVVMGTLGGLVGVGVVPGSLVWGEEVATAWRPALGAVPSMREGSRTTGQVSMGVTAV
ncbi:hypothetical protein Pelo_5626 [Pelomyxa schiedti]|nr:hypothetical protein Pelo_5626 [Pelomyxa schiedti]